MPMRSLHNWRPTGSHGAPVCEEKRNTVTGHAREAAGPSTKERNVVEDKVFFRGVALKLSVEATKVWPYHAYTATLSDYTAAVLPRNELCSGDQKALVKAPKFATPSSKHNRAEHQKHPVNMENQRHRERALPS